MTALTLLLALAAHGLAQAPSAEAQRRYDAGDYTAAATAFAKLAAEQPREAAWRYDLGNALFKAGRLGPAVASYQRAFELAPRDSDIAFNLDFALRRAGEELVPAGVPPLIYRAFHWLSAKELAGLHWLGCWASLLLGAAWLLLADRRAMLFSWLAGALALWILGGSWWFSRYWLEPSALGVVVKSTAELRSGPGDNFSVSFTVPEGRRVEILSEAAEWLEVGLAKEGAKGWVRAADVEKI
jgi:tetratricopeptide (TPR) repeat protein